MKKIIIVTTVPLSVSTLIKGQARYLSQFFNVKIVTSYSDKNKEISDYEGVTIKSIDMTRKITIFKDLKALYQIYSYFLLEKPDIVYTFTPKAGLLGMIASFLSRVPVRIHNIVGMPLMESRGSKRILLKFIERLTYFFSTQLFCNSFGLRDYVKAHLTKRDIKVIAQGSINGVDSDHFHNILSREEKSELRQKYQINDKDFVLIFVGRIVRDKGINELIESFVSLKKRHLNLKLLLVGDYEEHLNPINGENLEIIKNSNDIITVGFQNDIRNFLAMSDLFVLPSYREGLPNSLIEAGSYGIPLVATNINGCNEIVLEGETGLLVEKNSVDGLINAIELLLSDKILYDKIKSSVRGLTIKRYSQEFFLNELRHEIENSF